jgi:hypothetical protein
MLFLTAITLCNAQLQNIVTEHTETQPADLTGVMATQFVFGECALKCLFLSTGRQILVVMFIYCDGMRAAISPNTRWPVTHDLISG